MATSITNLNLTVPEASEGSAQAQEQQLVLIENFTLLAEEITALDASVTAVELSVTVLSDVVAAQKIPDLYTGDVNSPLAHIHLKNSLNMLVGVGSISMVRASDLIYLDRYGVAKTVAANLPGFESLGLLFEEASTNDALHCRDLTDVAWVKSSGTVALDATGLDAVPNAASSFTATGANATCLQTVTHSNEERTFSVDLKRRTGTGIVEITLDGGTIWTDITLFLSTTSYVRVAGTQTVTNSQFGIRLATSGDVIEVDYNQNEANTHASSRILTTTLAATRVQSRCYFASYDNLPQPESLTIIIDFILLSLELTQYIFACYDTGTNYIRAYVNAADNELFISTRSAAGLTSVSIANVIYPGILYRLGITIDETALKVYLDGDLIGEDLTPVKAFDDLSTTEFVLGDFRTTGSASGMNGHIPNAVMFDKVFSAEAMRVS